MLATTTAAFRPALRPLALSLAALGALSLGSMPAAAQTTAAVSAESSADMAMTVTRVPVKLSDLNLMTVQGRKLADRRVRAAAREACGISIGKVTLDEAQDQRNCFRVATRQGKVQVARAREQVLAAR